MSLLEFKHIVVPYIATESSQIWNQDLIFGKATYSHIKAASGKGKSSLMQRLYGLNQMFNGDIFLNQKNISTFNDDEWSEVRTNILSIVFQDLKLFEDQTAFNNIELKRVLTNFYPVDKIHAFARQLNVSHTLDRKISTLSYGERQRIAIIRALMQPFQLLLLDEPFSHLDEHNIQLASSLILNEVKSRNASLLLADLEEDQRFPYHQTIRL